MVLTLRVATSLQHVIENRLYQFGPMKKIGLRGSNKPHMIFQLRKAIMKRSRLKKKANESSKLADKAAYKTQINLVVKLNKEAQKSFLKNQITENATNKNNFFWKICNLFSLKKVFIINRNLLLKLKEV